jgi:hypothetical protein
MQTMTGTVESGPSGVGAKSEHEGVFLRVGASRYLLQRPDGNPFYDPVLNGLVGKSIAATGEVRDHMFLMVEWTETPVDGAQRPG